MASARSTTFLAAAGAALVAASILATHTIGWRGVAAWLSLRVGALGLLVAAVLVARDRRRVLADGLSRVGFLLVALGVLTILASVGLVVQETLDPTPCRDTGTCIPPGSEEIRTLGTGAAVLLLVGAATLLAQGIAGARRPTNEA